MFIITVRVLSFFMVVWMLIMGLYDINMVLYFGIAGIICWFMALMFFFYTAMEFGER